MPRKKRFQITLAILIALAALSFIAASFLPYVTLKHLLRFLMGSEHFKSLNDYNAIVFKILFGSAGLVLISLAYAAGFDHLEGIWDWLRQYGRDSKSFFTTLKPAHPDWLSWLILGLITGLGTVLRLPSINSILSHDEAYTFVVFSHTSLFNIISNYSLPNNHILNSILIYFSTLAFGIWPWAIRLPSLVAGLLLIPACYALAKTIYDPFTALASALMVAVLPGAILYSTMARGYSLVALFTLVGLWLAHYLFRNKNLFAWSLLVIAMALGFYSVPVMVFPFGIVFVWLFFENLAGEPGPYQSKINFLSYWLVAGISTGILVLLLYTPVFIYTGANKVFGNPWVQATPWSGYLASLPSYLLSVGHEWVDGLPQVWIILIIVGLILGVIFHRRIARQRFPMQAAALLWIGVLLLIQRPSEVSKIWAFLQAPGMIWACAGLFGPIKNLRLKLIRPVPVAAIPIALALLAVSIQAAQAVRSLPARWTNMGVTETVVRTIKDQLTPKDLIIIDSPYDSSVWYYSQLNGISMDRFDQRRSFDHLFVIVSHTDNQSISSVLKARGPDPGLINLPAAYFMANFQNLDIYVIPHR